MNECCCTKRTKHRDADELRRLRNRLKRIEGQVRGLSRMLDEEAYCVDIITQAAAVRSALNAFNKELLANHIRTCAASDIRDGKAGAADELIETVKKLI